MMRWLMLFAMFAMSAAACSDASVGSCSTPAQGGGSICVDFGAGYTASEAQQSCGTSTTSTYSTEACTSVDRVGHCTITVQSTTRTESFYPPLTLQQATDTCTASHGTFAAN